MALPRPYEGAYGSASCTESEGGGTAPPWGICKGQAPYHLHNPLSKEMLRKHGRQLCLAAFLGEPGGCPGSCCQACVLSGSTKVATRPGNLRATGSHMDTGLSTQILMPQRSSGGLVGEAPDPEAQWLGAESWPCCMTMFEPQSNICKMGTLIVPTS